MSAPTHQAAMKEAAADAAGGSRAGQATLAAIPTRIVLPLLLLAGGLLLGSELTQGWYPHDEGALGQAAERILAGEVPHRDFAEPYTGLLSYWHALVFSVLPVSSVSMRLPLFVAAMGWLMVLYRILVRFMPPAGAGLVALTALAWSVPNYPAPMPSWYIVFASGVAALALLRWHEDGGARWLVLAGVMAGLAFLFKLTGVLLLLGAGLALLAVERPAGGAAAPSAPPDAPALPPSATPSRGGYAWAVAVVLLAAPVLLFRVAGGGPAESLRFVLPTGALCLAVAWRVLRPSPVPDAARWRALAARLGPLLAGFALPVALYLAVQAAFGAMPALIEGVFIAPFRRSTFAAMRPPAPLALLFVLPMALALLVRSTAPRTARAVPVLAGVVGVAILALSGTQLFWYLFGWFSVWGLLFVLTAGAVEAALRPAARATAPATAPDAARVAALLLACLAVSGTLIEYPFASPIYVMYGLPLVLVALAAVVRTAGRVAPTLQVVLTGLALGFTALRMLPAWSGAFGVEFAPTQDIAPIELPRGGIRVTPLQAVMFEDMIPLVQQRAAGRPIWAGPDAPEIYFYSGIPNRTRTMFDFLDAPEDQARSLVERVESLGAGVVVIKLLPQFSPLPSAATVDSLRRILPNEKRYPFYLVLWR